VMLNRRGEKGRITRLQKADSSAISWVQLYRPKIALALCFSLFRKDLA
jgi:hypothetical protein